MALAKENSEPLVLRKDENGISNLIINRPKSYNALSIDCMEALMQEISAISEDPSIKVVILSGSGKGFCAGHDLKEMRADPGREFYEKTFRACAEMMMSIIIFRFAANTQDKF